MTDAQADTIYGNLVNAMGTCEECGERDNMLSLHVRADGDLVCDACEARSRGKTPSIEVLIGNENDVAQLRRALVGPVTI